MASRTSSGPDCGVAWVGRTPLREDGVEGVDKSNPGWVAAGAALAVLAIFQNLFEEGDGLCGRFRFGAVKGCDDGRSAVELDPTAKALSRPTRLNAGRGEKVDAAIPWPIIVDGRPDAGLGPGTCVSKCLT